ncbi:hypothetical protein APX70_05999 [Pseudomonas syringae pv. maculicola]|uniref:Uncharacterized protein n=1 Tax=Pseudomonas syringae pv. maculicola TaxID=59511 RepID=A0A3M3A9F1_PSEYM|nr:hypothetical protein APX70_05999 [Pseudomonas syringae pv. maculicola]
MLDQMNDGLFDLCVLLGDRCQQMAHQLFKAGNLGRKNDFRLLAHF